MSSTATGTYPAVTPYVFRLKITFEKEVSDYEKMATLAMLKIRMGGQGKKECKKPVLFPKIVGKAQINWFLRC